MTFGEALRAAATHGEFMSATVGHYDSPPDRLPAHLRGLFDDARAEALVGRMREAWWQHRYFALRFEYACSQRRLEDVA